MNGEWLVPYSHAVCLRTLGKSVHKLVFTKVAPKRIAIKMKKCSPCYPNKCKLKQLQDTFWWLPVKIPEIKNNFKHSWWPYKLA
jgi:hypothetical protein